MFHTLSILNARPMARILNKSAPSQISSLVKFKVFQIIEYWLWGNIFDKMIEKYAGAFLMHPGHWPCDVYLYSFIEMMFNVKSPLLKSVGQEFHILLRSHPLCPYEILVVDDQHPSGRVVIIVFFIPWLKKLKPKVFLV